MFDFIKLLGKLGKISSATDDLIHSSDELVKKTSVVTIVMTSLELAESKMKLDFVDDEKVKAAAVALADAVFDVISRR